MPHADWHKKPFLATILQQAILAESVEEVERLNEITDDYIAKIEENEKLYDENYHKLMKVKEQIETIKQWWEDTRETREKIRKAVKTATKAKKAGEATDKSSTLGMSLNPVLAAIQYATKLLILLLQSEINALFDVLSVLEPSQNEFIGFSGGTIDGVQIKGTFQEKIDAMEERMRKRKLARMKRKAKLDRKKELRISKINARKLAENAVDDAKQALGELAEGVTEGSGTSTYVR